MSEREESAAWERNILKLLRKIEELDGRIGKQCALGLDTNHLIRLREDLVSQWALEMVKNDVRIRHVPMQFEDVECAAQKAGSLKSWTDIEIAFLSDHRVEICYRANSRESCSYGELGFQDRRTGNPNRAWIVLQALAAANGTLPRPRPGRERSMIQKRVEEIREKLRDYFNIHGDPIPFNGISYQTSFKITRRPCADT